MAEKTPIEVFLTKESGGYVALNPVGAFLPDRATLYAEKVVSGEIVAGPHVRGACKRHLADLANDSPDWPYRYDLEKVNKAFYFFENIASLGVGKPFKALPWQDFVIGSVYGWVKKETGFRRFQTVYIETAKGSGKTPLGGLMGIKALCADGEYEAECVVGAATKEQAGIGFRDVVKSIKGSPLLDKHIKPSGGEQNEWRIIYKAKEGDTRFYKKVAFDTKHSGSRVSFIHLDELHEHPSDMLINMLSANFKARKQPLLVITTNTADDEFSVCQEYKDRGVKASAGITEDNDFFAYIAALDDEDLKDDGYLRNPACWIKTNPALPVLPGYDYLAKLVKDAEMTPSKVSNAKRLCFCQSVHEVGSLFNSDLWKKAENANLKLEGFKGKEVFLGLDLAFKTDFSALAFVFREPLDVFVRGRRSLSYKYTVFVEQWTPKEDLTVRARRDRAPYHAWVRDGYITAVDAPTIDMGWIAHRLNWVNDNFDIQTLAYDNYGYRHLERELEQYKLVLPTVDHPQGVRRSAAKVAEAQGRKTTDPMLDLFMPTSLSEFSDALKEGRLETPINPMSRLNIQSAKARVDVNGNVTVARKDYKSRVDGVVAMVQAVGAAHCKPHVRARKSYLLDDDVITV